jgi:hypothetical protein
VKRKTIILALLAASACALAAQEAAAPGSPSFSLSGAVAPRLGLSIENEGSAFAGLPGAAPYSDSSAAGALSGKLSFSRDYTSLGLLDFSFSDDAILAHADGSTLESMAFTVNELYADLNFADLLFLRLGKQRLSWGSGFVFNPSDPVNPPKDPTSRRAAREGVPSLKAELIAKPVSLMAFAVLHDELDETGYGGKLSTSAVPNTDLALSGYWSPSQSWTAAFNLSSAPLYDLPGWDSIQVWFEGSLYDEGRYAAYAEGGMPGSATIGKASGAQYSGLAGMSAQLPVLRTVLLAEYYRLSEGMSKGELADVYRTVRAPATKAFATPSAAWYAELGRRPGRQAKDYLFASLSQPSITDSGDPVFDKISLSASCLLNLADLSFYASGGVGLGFVENSSVDLSVNWAEGGSESEFGNLPSKLAMGLELKVFF